VTAHAVEAALLGFIAGVAVSSVVVYALRDRIRARMRRRRGG
jgi:hypothetical protein